MESFFSFPNSATIIESPLTENRQLCLISGEKDISEGGKSLDSCQMRSVKGVVGGMNDGEDPRVCNMGLLNSGPNGEGALKGIRSWCFA